MKQQLEPIKSMFEATKRPQAALVPSSVTSSHLFALQTPQTVQDYEEREQLLKAYPLARALLDKGYPVSSLASLLRCGMYNGDGVKRTCACGPKKQKIFRLRHHCSSRTCPFCAKIRKRRVYRKMMPLLQNLVTTPLNRVRFFTIKPKNFNSYAEGEEHLRKSLSKFWRRKYVSERVTGGICVIEAKSTLEKGWNVHAHVIYYGREMNNRLYGHCKNCKRRMWLKYDKDAKRFYCSKQTCNSIKVYWDGENSKLTKELTSAFKIPVQADVRNLYKRRSHKKNVQHSLNYCLKYVSVNKNSFANMSDLAEYMTAIRDRKLIMRFGVFHSASFEPLKPECPDCHKWYDWEYVLDYSINSSILPVP